MIVIAIDPGFDRLGWAVAQILPSGRLNLLSFGLLTTSKADPLFSRYRQLDQQLSQILTEYRPQEAAIESLFFFKNQKTVMQVAETRGLILSALLRHGLQVFEYTPPQIKSSVTGYGRADKQAIEKMVQLQLQIPPGQKIIDDTFDALAILLTHAGSRRLAQSVKRG